VTTRQAVVALVLAAVATTRAAAQDVARVTDRESGRPIAGAQVSWIPDSGEAPAGGLLTAGDGSFRVPVAWQHGRLRIRAIGYRAVAIDRAEARGDVPLDALPELLAEVVVTASGRVQPRSEVALPVLRVDAGEIAASGAASAGSLLQEIPGLQAVAGTPIGSTIAIRGIGDARVLVLVDGQPAGGALIENRDLSRLSLAGVERVEVVKGPLSSLYGSDALGGVINVITEAPAPGFRLGSRVLYGDGGRREAEATVSGGDAVRFRATGGWREQDGVPGAGLGAFARVWDFRSTARYGDPGALQLRGDLSALRERQRWPVGAGFNGFNDNVGVTGWAEGSRPAFGGTVSLRVLGQAYDHLYRSNRGDAPIAGGDSERQEERLWRVASGWSGTMGDHDVDVGVELADRGITSPGKVLDDRAGDSQVDLYAQDAWRLPATTLTAGARATINDRWGNAVSPTLGLSTLRGNVRLRASLGRGFRAPSFKELSWNFANVGAGYTVQGNPDLTPERSWNLSGGLELTPDPRLTLALDAYVNHLTDLIEFAFIGNTPAGMLVYSPRNVQRARTSGAEASIGWRADHWHVLADYAFLRALSLDDDLALDRRAPHTTRLRLGGDLRGSDAATFEVDARHTSAAPIISTSEDAARARIGTQAALNAIDVTASFRVLPGTRFVAGVDNLFDHAPDGWLSVIGRRVRLEIRVNQER
jgi:outer membrane receptor for ferrienterochelin and colicins